MNEKYSPVFKDVPKEDRDLFIEVSFSLPVSSRLPGGEVKTEDLSFTAVQSRPTKENDFTEFTFFNKGMVIGIISSEEPDKAPIGRWHLRNQATQFTEETCRLLISTFLFKLKDKEDEIKLKTYTVKRMLDLPSYVDTKLFD